MNAAYIEIAVQVAMVLFTGFLLPAAKRWLDSRVHANDMAALVGALSRAAQLVAADYTAGRIALPQAATGIADYAVKNLPEIVAKLAPSPETLADMAKAVLLEKAVVQSK